MEPQIKKYSNINLHLGIFQILKSMSALSIHSNILSISSDASFCLEALTMLSNVQECESLHNRQLNWHLNLADYSIKSKVDKPFFDQMVK